MSHPVPIIRENDMTNPVLYRVTIETLGSSRVGDDGTFETNDGTTSRTAGTLKDAIIKATNDHLAPKEWHRVMAELGFIGD